MKAHQHNKRCNTGHSMKLYKVILTDKVIFKGSFYECVQFIEDYNLVEFADITGV